MYIYAYVCMHICLYIHDILDKYILKGGEKKADWLENFGTQGTLW
jgi:hypothetical protein